MQKKPSSFSTWVKSVKSWHEVVQHTAIFAPYSYFSSLMAVSTCFFKFYVVLMCLVVLLHTTTSHKSRSIAKRHSKKKTLVCNHSKLRLPVTFSSHTVSIYGGWMHHALCVLSLFPPSHFMFTSGTPSPDLWLNQEFLIDRNVQPSALLTSLSPCPGLLNRRLTVCILRLGAAGCDHQHVHAVACSNVKAGQEEMPRLCSCTNKDELLKQRTWLRDCNKWPSSNLTSYFR